MNATANPYTAQLLEVSTRTRVNSFDTGLLNSLTAFSVLFGVALFFALASLALRWRNGTLWFFRTVATSQGSLIIAHESNVHTLFSIAFLGAIQHYLIVARQTSTVGSILRNSVISRTYPWYILYLSSWSIIWESFTTAYIETGAAEKKSRLTPKMVNVFFIAFPLLISIAPCFTFLVLANTRYNLFFDNIGSLFRQLTVAADRYDNQQPVDVLPLLALFQIVTKQAEDAGFVYRISWILTLIPMFISVGIFIFSSVVYARFLTIAMNRLRAQRRAGSTFLAHYRSVALAQRSNWATLSVVVFIYVMWIGLAAWLAVDIQRIARDPRTGQLIILIPLWFYAPLGFFSHLTILIRSVDWRYVNPSSAVTTSTTTSAGQRNSILPPNKDSEDYPGSPATTRSFEMNHYYSTHLDLNAKGKKEAPFATDEGDKVEFESV